MKQSETIQNGEREREDDKYVFPCIPPSCNRSEEKRLPRNRFPFLPKGIAKLANENWGGIRYKWIHLFLPYPTRKMGSQSERFLTRFHLDDRSVPFRSLQIFLCKETETKKMKKNENGGKRGHRKGEKEKSSPQSKRNQREECLKLNNIELDTCSGAYLSHLQTSFDFLSTACASKPNKD